MRFCKPGERIAWLVAKEIATYLGLHERDRLNSYRYSPRERMFEWLHELPAGTYQRAAEDLLASARRMAQRDAWESCHFASLFAHYRAFRYEQIVLETAANALPEEPRHESFRGGLRQLAMVAVGNASLSMLRGVGLFGWLCGHDFKERLQVRTAHTPLLPNLDPGQQTPLNPAADAVGMDFHEAGDLLKREQLIHV
jgi:hypothetical protein